MSKSKPKPKLSTVATAPSSEPVSRLLTRLEVLALLNVTYPTLWGWVRDGHFPPPRELGWGKKGRIGWVQSEVQAWIASLPKRLPKGTKISEVA
jgi:predicted DNA-binding transcriptional regulator AlpA